MDPTLRRAVDWLSSIRVARGLLIVIGLLALVGTLIPQQEEPAAYLSRFGPAGTQWLAQLGLTDLYHSWYLASLLVLLAVSLVVCSIRRWTANLKTLGSIATHIGFVLIIAGGMIRDVAGVEGIVELQEGEQTSQLQVTETQSQPLSFAVQLEDFYLTRYADNPGTISEFVSRIRLIGADAATRATVRVNHPITHRGFRIYQLGYDPDNPAWTALLLVRDPGIPVVYTGFGLLLAGLLMTFYLVPLMASRRIR